MKDLILGQVVYTIHRERNIRGVNKWHVGEGTEIIIDIYERTRTNNKKKEERKFVYYRFSSNPTRKVKSDQVFDSYESAEEQCAIRNQWGKHHPRSKGYKETHKNKFKKKKDSC